VNNHRNLTNNHKNLTIVIAVLVVVIAASAMIYSVYKDRVDPLTGKISSTTKTESEVSPASNFESFNSQEVAASVSKAPDFTMQDANGKDVLLSSFQGTPVVLNFWTSWCSYCKAEMPYFESAYKQYGDKIKFVMLNPVKSERSSEGGKNFIKESAYTFPVFYETEGKSMNLYGLRSFPATVFIDANGNMIEKTIGAISEDKLQENIKSLIGQQ